MEAPIKMPHQPSVEFPLNIAIPVSSIVRIPKKIKTDFVLRNFSMLTNCSDQAISAEKG